ncbi:tRNA nucleotidyltransferase [Bacillus toyonensis BCT-7112]|nr:tRNA nucleotidyltransferase [Bacillus toyonensis BCT-7112]
MAERVYEAMIENYNPTSVKRVQSMFHALPIKGRQDMNVSGNDLLNWANKKPGPWVAEMLQKIEEAIVQGNVVNEKESIREWLQRCNLL